MKISFMASLQPIQSAINLDGRGDGARIRLDTPANELPQVLKLTLLAGQAFRVTVEAEGQE